MKIQAISLYNMWKEWGIFFNLEDGSAEFGENGNGYELKNCLIVNITPNCE